MCYTVPAISAVVASALWWRRPSRHLGWLNLLLWGATVFGIIDHAWNGELFLVGAGWKSDLLLGVTITAGLFVLWGGVMLAGRRTSVARKPTD